MECHLENITVHYELFGQGRPTIILPGWTLNARATAHGLEPIFQQRAGWQRIYIDPPGHGKTPGKDWITNQDKMLEVILAFIEKVIPQQRFLLAGVSLGSYLARGVLYHYQRSINGLLMLVPVILAEDNRRTAPPYTVLVEDPAVMAELTLDEAAMFEMAVVRTRKFLDVQRAYPHLSKDEQGDPKFLEKIRQDPAKYAFSFDVDALPEPFPGPTLIIAGRQDAVVGYEDAYRILKNYPRATYVVLDRAGHFLEEKEMVIHLLVNEWLDRVEESVASGEGQ
jgi:pimeloyl-ACP methyl ester carboxylesterase